MRSRRMKTRRCFLFARASRSRRRLVSPSRRQSRWVCSPARFLKSSPTLSFLAALSPPARAAARAFTFGRRPSLRQLELSPPSIQDQGQVGRHLRRRNHLSRCRRLHRSRCTLTFTPSLATSLTPPPLAVPRHPQDHLALLAVQIRLSRRKSRRHERYYCRRQQCCVRRLSCASARRSKLTSILLSNSTSFAKNPKRTTSAPALAGAAAKKGGKPLTSKGSSFSFRKGGFS